jgi:tetratricopeptide (TPR) repeat protein
MDLQDRLTQLENVRDWQGLVEELEKGLANGEASNAVKAAHHLHLGKVWRDKFLSGVKALKHFQDAYKLNPQLLEALEAARGVYWDLGKVNMVQKLLELELKTERDAVTTTALLLELGDVASDAADYEKATATYARALGASGGSSDAARAALEDIQVDEASWQDRVAELLRTAGQSDDATARSALFLRAARLAKRFAPSELLGLLEKAYAADPLNRQVAALFEGAHAEAGSFEALEAVQKALVSGASPALRGATAVAFGARWVGRHQQPDVGARFLEEAVRADGADGAFTYLRDTFGKKGGDWNRVLVLAEEAGAAAYGDKSFIVAQAAVIAWRNLGNLMRARSNFERLAAIDPEHPQLKAFEEQTGEQLTGGAAEPEARVEVEAEAPAETAVQELPLTALAPQPVPTIEMAPVVEEAAPVSAAPVSAQPVSAPATSVAPPAAASDDATIAALRAQAEKQEAAKRYNEYVKTLLQLAAAVPDAAERVDLYMKAADLYVSKFANQAEAVKAYEQVLAIDESNETAASYLRQMYEKRRDWEKLVALERRAVEALDPGIARAEKFFEIAKLATDKIKKPEICIELWNEVLANDDQNQEALSSLSGLFERSKEFDKLAEVLEKQAQITYDTAAKIQILTKLGTIYGDRLNNDEGAVQAWRELLTLDPSDRKAQEALKKKYLALGLWDELEVFYAESGKWDEFIRVLEQQEAKETRDDAKIGLLFKIAELWADKKQKNDRASKAYEKVLELEADNLRAAEALIPIYQAAGNGKALAGAIEVKLLHETDEDVRIELLREVAGLYEGKVKEPQKAFERYLAAFELRPFEDQASSDLERAAKVTGSWEQVISAYNKAIEDGSTNPDGQIALRLRLGRVLVEEVARIDDALAAYRAVYEVDGENDTALSALERLYRQVARFGDLLEIYERKRDLAVDPDEKKRIQYEIAKLFENEVKDVDKAIDTYNAVLEDDAQDAVSLQALDVLYGRLERWQPYADTLRRRIELEANDTVLVDLKYRLGRTLELHLGDAPAALENYREILVVDGGHDAAREALEALLAHETLAGEAAAILESIYEERADWTKLVQALEILSATAEELGRRVELERKIARVAGDALNNKERAFVALSAALRFDPTLAETRGEIEIVAESANKWSELVALYAAIATESTDADLSRFFWMRVARINDERLGLVDEAAAAYDKVLALDAADQEALFALEQLFTRTDRWTDLIKVKERCVEQSQDAGEGETLYAQIAAIYDQKLGSLEAAVASYNKVLEIDPSSLLALQSLDDLFTRQKLWNDLAENLEKQLSLAATDEEQLALMLRLAALRETEMAQVEVAIEGYRAVLERDASNAQAFSALERLGTQEAYELVIADLLEPFYTQLGDHQKLIGALEVQVKRSDDPSRRVELLHRIAQLHEDAAQDFDAAFETLARALREDPSSEETVAQLDRVARTTARFADLAAVYQSRGAKIAEDVTQGVEGADPDLAASLYMRAAFVQEQDLGETETAIALYRTVLEIAPIHLGAAESLERLYRGLQRWADLSLVLQRKSGMLDEPLQQKDALFQAASIEEDVLGQPEAAIAVYKKVLDIDADDVQALDALVRRYLGLKKWAELLEVYARKVDLVADPEEKKLIYYQVGAVYERELGDVPQSIDTYNKILEIDPDDLQALSRLDVLYEQAQNWQELLVVLTRESEMTADPQEGISFQYRIAELYEKRLEDVARSVELYRDILGQQPDHGPTLVALEGLKAGEKDPLGAAAVLEPVYESAGAWRELISVHEVQVAHADDPFAKVDLLHRIARLHEDALSDHASAFATFARAIVFDNANEQTLSNLERLAMALGRWAEVTALYDAELDKLAENPDRLVELGLRVAQLYETQLEDVESAIARYRRVLEVEPENQSAVRSLDRLFTQTERWSDLATILAKEAEIGQDPADVLTFKYRLGQVREHRLQDVNGAIAAYREVLEAEADHADALEAVESLFARKIETVVVADLLEPLYRDAEQWTKLIAVHEAQLAHTEGQEERLAGFYRIAALHEEKLLDAPTTLDTYIRALKEFPVDERSGEEAPRLAAIIDAGFETLANAYADILGLHTDVKVQGEVGRRLAKTFEEDLGDVEKAEETYRYVLSVDGQDQEALSNLDRIYLAMEAWPELAGILDMRTKAPAEAYELIELFARLGEVYETKIGDIPNAIRAYRRIFDELDKTHEGAIAALARIYESQSAWRELDTVYLRELENASGDTQESEIRARIANLAATHLGEIDRAIETWKQVLDLRGEDPEALYALSNLYEREQRHRDLVEILERQASIAESDDDRVEILARRARTFTEKLAQDDLAYEDWTRVLDVDYANLEALRAICAIRRRQADAQELVTAIHQFIDRAAGTIDSGELRELYRELGKTYGGSLEQPFDAAEAWRHLLETGADFEAYDALEAIYRADERIVDVIDVKMQRAEALEDVAAKIAEFRSVAMLWTETLEEPDKSTDAWQKIIEADAAHDEAFAELEKLHIAANRWEPLIELYLGRLDTRDEDKERTDLLRKIAGVFEEKLDDKGQAFDALSQALEIDIFDTKTTKYLEKMAQATGRWGELITMVQAWLKATQEPARKVRLCLHLAKWYGDDLGHPEHAQPYYTQIVTLDPNNVGAFRQLAQLYRKGANWQQYGSTLQRALDVAVTEGDRKEVLTELGELLDGRMGQTDQAIDYFQRALKIDAHFLAALANLERIYEARGANRELSEVLVAKVPALTEPEVIAQTKLRIGGLYEQLPQALPRAAETYREVLEIDPASISAMRGLARVYEGLGQWSELVKILEAELEVVETERERIELLMQLATIHETHFVKADVAAARLEQVVDIDPNHEPAYVALARNYRRLRQWHDLINAYERHITATLQRQTKVELYGSIAQVYAGELDDVDRAIDAYRNIVDLDDQNVPALDALSKLYDKQGDASSAVDFMTRVADLTPDPAQRVESFYRIGKVLDEKLGDRVAAQDRYELALDLDPAHILTLGALRQIAMDNADYDKAARYIDQEQSYTQAPRQRARLLVELGRLREEMLGEHEGAVLAWESALEADSENEDAAIPLVADYVATEQWAKAEPLLDALTRKAGKRDRAEQHDLWSKLGKVAAALGKDEKALKAYQTAQQLDLTNQETIRGLAEVSFRLKDWASALTNFQKVLTSLGEEETDARAEVYFKLGSIKREQGQPKQAIANFDKALEILPGHRPTLDALVAIYSDAKDFKQVVAFKRMILDDVMDGDLRFDMLSDIADVWEKSEKNIAKAIEALEEAKDLKPSDLPLLNRLLMLYPQVKNWGSMADVLQAMSEIEKDPARKAIFLFTMAQLYRDADKLNDTDRAIELFNESLDANPNRLEAFERINKILTDTKDWKQLERAYRKMLRRLATANVQNADLSYSLWHGLGLIYRDRLQDANSAIEAFKMATREKPEDATERQILAELYEVTDQVENSRAEYFTLLEKDPMKEDAYRSLYRLALRIHDYDRAWTLCAALSFLGKADDEERGFFEQYRQRGMVQVKNRLDNEQWVRNLFHKDENLYIGKIFEMITPAVIVANTRRLQAERKLPALNPAQKQDPAQSTVTFSKTFFWASTVLGVQAPDLYLRNDVQGALVAVPTAPPASVAGQTVLTGFTPQELTFIVGKHLATYRGEHYMKNLFPTLAELKLMLFSAIKVILPDFAVPPDMAQAVTATAQQLAQLMQPLQREGLKVVVQKFVQDGAKADLKRWIQAVEVTAARAGLVLCGDLDIAKKIIAAEPQLPGDLSPSEKLKELIVFSVSDPYLALRKNLGIAIGQE